MARGFLLFAALLTIASCTARPGPEVLVPEANPLPPGTRSVDVLTVTTRAPVSGNPMAFGSDRSQQTARIAYAISVPPDHKAGQIEWPAQTSDPVKNFTVRTRSDLTRQAFERKIAGQRVGMYVHGFNTNYQEALFRAAQLSADSHLKGLPIVFTWPSAGQVGAYLSDRDASDFSRSALAELLVQVTREHPVRDPVPVLAHSMGARLTMETLRQLKLAGRDDVLARIELVLAAPDIDLDLFREQMAVIGRLQHPITVLVSSDDDALRISSRLATGRVRLGLADVHDPAIRDLAVQTGIRIVDITELPGGDPAHSRYISLLSSENSATTVIASPIEGVRQVGAFVFAQVGGALQIMSGALTE